MAEYAQVGASIGRLQEDAKAIKNDLSAMHSQHKSRQTSKILSDFEVGLLKFVCLSHLVLLHLLRAVTCLVTALRNTSNQTREYMAIIASR